MVWLQGWRTQFSSYCLWLWESMKTELFTLLCYHRISANYISSVISMQFSYFSAHIDNTDIHKNTNECIYVKYWPLHFQKQGIEAPMHHTHQLFPIFPSILLPALLPASKWAYHPQRSLTSYMFLMKETEIKIDKSIKIKRWNAFIIFIPTSITHNNHVN